MRAADLFDCFERHLHNLTIENEHHDLFVVKVVEDYILNLTGMGYTLGQKAEEVYSELYIEVSTMLHKKIYGYYNLDHYREVIRQKLSLSA